MQTSIFLVWCFMNSAGLCVDHKQLPMPSTEVCEEFAGKLKDEANSKNLGNISIACTLIQELY